MKTFLSANSKENNTRSYFSNFHYSANKKSLKITDLKINTNNNVENMSPNSNDGKTPSNIINVPSTVKNFQIKKTQSPSFNTLSTMPNGPLSNKYSENKSDKKMLKISSITELNRKTIESGRTNSCMIGINNKKEEKTANLEKVKISHKKFGVIEAYGAITTEGICRDYNEDRVSIIFNISKPQNFIETADQQWPKCSFFGLYDGHGGTGCADFIRDNLHKFIINDPNFPKNPQKAMMNGFVKIEKAFYQKSLQIEKLDNKEEKITLLDRSGSCAIVVLIVEKRCYIANVGDSRAIMSGNFGEKVYALSKDHRPVDEKEYTRILEAGGKIYQTEANLSEIYGPNYTGKNPNIVGPLRVFPGKLSVCRAIGDIEAKEPKLGGNPNVVIATPEIKYFDINPTNDFILIGCDGIFEKFKNKEIIESMWKNLNGLKCKNVKDIHNVNGLLLENLIDECISKRSTDNLTAVMISFKDNLIEKDLVPDYICQTQQCNKIPKIIKTESNVNSIYKHASNAELNQNNILSKIIRSTQFKSSSIQPSSERFMTLNK